MFGGQHVPGGRRWFWFAHVALGDRANSRKNAAGLTQGQAPFHSHSGPRARWQFAASLSTIYVSVCLCVPLTEHGGQLFISVIFPVSSTRSHALRGENMQFVIHFPGARAQRKCLAEMPAGRLASWRIERLRIIRCHFGPAGRGAVFLE